MINEKQGSTRGVDVFRLWADGTYDRATVQVDNNVKDADLDKYLHNTFSTARKSHGDAPIWVVYIPDRLGQDFAPSASPLASPREDVLTQREALRINHDASGCSQAKTFLALLGYRQIPDDPMVELGVLAVTLHERLRLIKLLMQSDQPSVEATYESIEVMLEVD